MRKFLAVLFASPLLVILIAIVIINFRVHYDPEVFTLDQKSIDNDLLKQLQGLKHQIDNGADDEMQAVYPEGYVFLNSIYGLAWCNVVRKLPGQSSYYNEGYSEIKRSWAKIDSDHARASFEEDLPLPYGAFYMGWSNYFLAQKLSIESPDKRDTSEAALFKRNCEKIAIALQANIYPVSYYGQSWPADVTICVASLALHDKIFQPEYEEIIARWINLVKLKLDTNGLIPHAVHPTNQSIVESARGSSQSLMLIMLKDIDDELALEHFQKYKMLFVDTTFGLTGVREYPKGNSGTGDIDSGPVILGYGGAATIVGMQTLSTLGDKENAVRVRKAVEGLSMPIASGNKKNYFFGLMAVADAFIAWGDSTMENERLESNSFLTFHLYSAMAFSLVSVFFWIVIKPKKPDSRDMLNVPW